MRDIFNFLFCGHFTAAFYIHWSACGRAVTGSTIRGERKPVAPGPLRDKGIGCQPSSFMGLQIIQIVFNTGRKRIISFCTIHRKLKWTQRKEILNSCCVFKMRYSGTWICNEFQIASTTRTLNFHILFCLSSNNCTLNKSFGTNETSKCHFPLLFGSSSEKLNWRFIW